MSSTFLPTFQPSGVSTCLTGRILQAPPTSQFAIGSHVLVDLIGNLITSLRSDTVDLSQLEGQFVTVCGVQQVIQSLVHGRQVLLTVTAVLAPQTVPVPTRIDLRRLLLLLLLTNPGLFQSRPDLFTLLQGGSGTFAGI